MFNKRLEEQVDYLEAKLDHYTHFYEAKIAKLERIIAESGIVVEYEEKDPVHTLYNLNGTFYTIKKGK